MHIMEGFLPPVWALPGGYCFYPACGMGWVRLRRIVQEDNHQKVLLALCGAFIFVLSALKIPSVTGSCSHPTGVGLAVILFGPGVVAILGAVVLLFQALLLAHGGLTTLGANGMSMAVIGPVVGYLVWKMACRAGLRRDVAVFSVCDAGGFGDLFCDFSPAWRCVSRSPCRSDRVCCEVYGDFLPHTDSCRHCRRFINRHDL
ncbi:cobalamin biosynthesis protein [Salmonella enterica subsp. enterica]|nr:cobalamin biosynthesis protein [Salmonella enterica subsp. enterica]